MAGNFSNYAEVKVLDHVLSKGVRSYSQPVNLYLALSTTTITDTTTGSTIVETDDVNYARIECNDWETANDRFIENSILLRTLNKATKGWGVVTDWAVCDAITGGNIIAYGKFAEGKSVVKNAICRVKAGEVKISMSIGGMTDYLANKILDHFFKGSAYTPPNTLYAGLSLSSINRDGDVDEPIDAEYQRIDIGNFAAADNGDTSNVSKKSFPDAGVDWGEITHAFLADGDDNVLFFMALDVPITIDEEDIFSFEIGDFVVNMD